MEYRAQEVFQAAASVARKGWKAVKLYGVRDNCTCTCHKGAACKNPGKHPIGDEWHLLATDDEEQISDWFHYGDDNENLRINVGVRLGKASGIIDVEIDGPEAEATLKRYGLDLIETPTYKASRGSHRLFLYEDDLPDVGVVKVDQLEVRLGGGGKAAQSVMPSSWHRTGIQYLWQPGLSPDDVEPAPLPPEFKAAIKANSKKGGSGAICQAVDVVRDNRQITAGGRHGFLVGYASRLARTFRDFTAAERQELINILSACNQRFCSPAKDEDEVQRIANDQFDHYRDKAVERRAGKLFERYGLRWNDETREYDPGEWKLTRVNSDPVEFRLTLPFNGRTITASFDAKQIVEPKDVAGGILAAGGPELRDPHTSKWCETWVGYTIRNDDGVRDVRGLKSKLFEEADEENPSVDSMSYSQHAAFLISYLRPFSRSDDDDDVLPCPDGTPKWIKSEDGTWSLYFKWNELCAAAWRAAKAGIPTAKEKTKLRRHILAEAKLDDFVDKKFTVNGKANRWIVWDDRHMAALDRLTGA